MNNWRRIIVPPDMNIIDSMKIINEAATQFVMVLSKQDELLGVVTDGDIRRGILKNIPLTASVDVIMNRNPLTMDENVSKKEAFDFLQSKHITHVPLVNSSKRVVGVISVDDRLKNSGFQNTVVLMVGGLGSRLGHLTTNCPKPMLKVGGKPVLEIILSNLKDHGFHDFVFCVNFKADMIQSHFGDGSAFGVSVRYVHEEKRMGTAGALSLLPPGVTGPFLVMNGDILTKVNFSKLIEFHSSNKSSATMCVRKYDFQIPFGVVNSVDGRINGIEEKPVHSFLVSAGIYLVEEECLKHIPSSDFFDMPQLFNQMIKNKENAQAFPIHEYWLDIGREDDLNRAHDDIVKGYDN
jgi:dTDP-glucose pyrophosphorylase